MRINLAPLTAIFQPLAMKVAGGACLALALFAGVQTVRLAWANETLAKERASRETAIRIGIQIARQADQNALEKSQGVKDGIEAGNDAARAAAAGSDDPLRDAMEAIR